MSIENAGIVIANRTTEAGAGMGVVGVLSNVDWMSLAGILLAVAGFIANLYYQRRRDRRERLEHEARMAAIQKEQCKT